jgi:hypothetical protein
MHALRPVTLQILLFLVLLLLILFLILLFILLLLWGAYGSACHIEDWN